MVRVDSTGEAPFRQHRAVLPDGRRLLSAEYGDTRALPVLYLHGFLGSRLEPRVVGETGLRLLAIDRPGYGGSSLRPEASLRAFGEDVRALLDGLGIERVGVIGMSAGGPYAIATAAVLGRRVERLALIGAVANKKTIRSMGGAVQLFRPLRRHGRLALNVMPTLFRQARRHGLEASLVEMMLRNERHLLTPEVDRTHLVRAMIASLREGTRPGLGGGLADMEVLTRRWDVRPAEIACPALVVHGLLDRIVPLAHAHWYVEHLPDAHLELVADAGHVSVALNHARAIARWISARD